MNSAIVRYFDHEKERFENHLILVDDEPALDINTPASKESESIISQNAQSVILPLRRRQARERDRVLTMLLRASAFIVSESSPALLEMSEIIERAGVHPQISHVIEQ